MATIKTVILLCFAAVFVGAQIVDVANSGERITGGSPAVQGQFKWHAGIRYNFDNGSYQFFQNGALISNQWVLTLSTVVYEYEGNDIQVILGATRAFDYQEGRVVIKGEMVAHTDMYFVALVKLVKPVEFTDFIAPIKLPKATDYLGISKVWASGWGLGNNDVGNELNFIELETMTNEKCKETIPSIPEYVVCIDLSNGKCFNANDYGGALVQPLNGDWIHVGLMFGATPNLCDRPATNIRTTAVLDFILYNTGPIPL